MSIEALKQAYDSILVEAQTDDIEARIVALNRQAGFLEAINQIIDLIGAENATYFMRRRIEEKAA